MTLSGQVLEIPGNVAGLRVESERGIGIERIPVGAAGKRAQGLACAVPQ